MRSDRIAATALMLAAMGERSFSRRVRHIKTEPVQVALFGLFSLGDKSRRLSAAAILIATAGVIVISLSHATATPVPRGRRLSGSAAAQCSRCRPSAIAVRSCRSGLRISVLAATFTVTVGLVIQAALLSAYLVLRDPKVLHAIARAVAALAFAGFMGAFASEFWFLAFAITTAANVRTLALVEVLFAQGVTRFIFKQPTTRREGLGIVLVVIGVALLVWAY